MDILILHVCILLAQHPNRKFTQCWILFNCRFNIIGGKVNFHCTLVPNSMSTTPKSYVMHNFSSLFLSFHLIRTPKLGTTSISAQFSCIHKTKQMRWKIAIKQTNKKLTTLKTQLLPRHSKCTSLFSNCKFLFTQHTKLWSI